MKITISTNRSEILKEIKEDGSHIEYISKEFQNDYEIVLEATKTFDWALQYASEELQDDYEIVWSQLQLNPYALEFASDDIKHHDEIIRFYIDHFVGKSKMYKDINEFFIHEECLVNKNKVKRLYDSKVIKINTLHNRLIKCAIEDNNTKMLLQSTLYNNALLPLLNYLIKDIEPTEEELEVTEYLIQEWESKV